MTAAVGQTIWQENASRFASSQPEYIDQERHAGVRDALQALREGRPGYALFKLARSVERQNRIAGGGTVTLGICPACGSVCVHEEEAFEAGRVEGRAEAVTFLRDQAAAHTGEVGDARRRGALNAAADDLRDGRKAGRR